MRPQKAAQKVAQKAVPVRLRAGDVAPFPDPRRYDQAGLVAVGGDLHPKRLLHAYSLGIFPWYSEGMVPLWWSPDPRALFTPQCLKVSKSLRKTLRKGGFTLSWNRAFAEVVEGCAQGREEGTWIVPDMRKAYCELHRVGAAHSLEVWHEAALVGGLYGVQCGGLFAAESMFHRATDMSKVALVAAVHSLFAAGITLMDAQMPNDHLLSMGCAVTPRDEYLRLVEHARPLQVDLRALQPAVDQSLLARQ